MNTNLQTPEAMRAALFEILHNFAPEADLNSLPADAPIREYLDIDSLDAFNILVQVHKRFGIEIPESDYGKLVTLNNIISYLTK